MRSVTTVSIFVVLNILMLAASAEGSNKEQRVSGSIIFDERAKGAG